MRPSFGVAVEPQNAVTVRLARCGYFTMPRTQPFPASS